MNIDFRPSNFNPKRILGVPTVLQRKNKLENDGVDVVNNIRLIEVVLYDGGGNVNIIKIQKKRISTEGVVEVEKEEK